MTLLADELARRPFHLALSAGWFGFYAHAGFVAALADRGLRPASWSGASAGALIAALAAAGLGADDLARELGDLRRRDFWDPGLGLGLLRGRKLEDKLTRLAPVARLEDCREPVAISLLDLKRRRLLIRRHGDLARVVRAALAIFPLFMPARLEEGPVADGGGLDRPALGGLEPGRLVVLHDLPRRSGLDRAPGRDDLELERLLIPDLPRLGPFRLAQGPEAIDLARHEAGRWLDSPRPSS